MQKKSLSYRGISPVIADDAWIAPSAVVIGDVSIGAQSSIWFQSVLRGDVASIRVGARVNIQDGTVVHVARGRPGTVIGDDVSIGHMALIHACELQAKSFVGMGAIVMDGCVLEQGSMLAAGALLTPGKRIAKGELWAGRPAQLMRALTNDDYRMMAATAVNYVALSREYMENSHFLDGRA